MNDDASRSHAKSPDHTALGRAVRIMRATRGLSQEELGHRANLHRNYIGAIERGEINPTFRVLLNLEHGLAMPLSELIAKYEEIAVSPDLALPPRLRQIVAG
jgi:transcriptional regulator with XRE-family HTH domain